MTVVILEDAAEDLESGAQFYESCATGVGDYFLDSIFSDLDSQVLFAGVHPSYFGFQRMLSKLFPFDIYYEVETPLKTFKEPIKEEFQGQTVWEGQVEVSIYSTIRRRIVVSRSSAGVRRTRQ